MVTGRGWRLGICASRPEILGPSPVHTRTHPERSPTAPTIAAPPWHLDGSPFSGALQQVERAPGRRLAPEVLAVPCVRRLLEIRATREAVRRELSLPPHRVRPGDVTVQ